MPDIIDKSILESGIKAEHIPKLEAWGEYLANGVRNGREVQVKNMTTSQIRKFFGEIKRIQADFDNCKQDVILLDPKIAYSVGRAKKDASRGQSLAIEEFYKLVKPMISTIGHDKSRFKHFVQVCEAIVAYHRAKGGN